MRLVRSGLLWWLHLPVGVRLGRSEADAVRRRIEITARPRLVRAGVRGIARTVVVAFFVVVVAPALLDLARVRGGSERSLLAVFAALVDSVRTSGAHAPAGVCTYGAWTMHIFRVHR